MGAKESACRANACQCDPKSAQFEVIVATAPKPIPAREEEAEEAMPKKHSLGMAVKYKDTDVEEDDETRDADPPRSDSKSRRSRLLNHALVPDMDIMRGVSMKDTLLFAGRIWRLSPTDMPERVRAGLWNRSKQLDHFDVFLSHTWLTKGRSKFLSLALQCGWRHIVLSWFLAVLFVESLVLMDLLPSHTQLKVTYQGMRYLCPFGAWGLYLGNLMSLLAFFAAPGGAGQFCFLDVASINQVDEQMMERGIYGLGGFLSVSKELRILWSSPYLSRLWCIFEIAAYRFANPGGTITFAPLFLEVAVAKLWLGQYVTMVLFTILLIFTNSRTQNMLLPALLFFCVIFHQLRKSMLSKKELFLELRNFDLDKVQCKKEFDRKFIYSAIEQWYGSQKAFTDYVRGPLQEELLKKQADTQLPLQYTFIILTPLLSIGMDGFVAFIRSGVPTECLVSYGFSVVLGVLLCWAAVVVRMGVFLCDRFAAPCASGLCDYLQSVAIFLVFVVAIFAGVGIGAGSYTRGTGPAFSWFSCSLLLFWLTHGGWAWLAKQRSSFTSSTPDAPRVTDPSVTDPEPYISC